MTERTQRKFGAAIAAVLISVAAAGCAATPATSQVWELQPIQVPNPLTVGDRRTDVTYPMALTSDQEGGFWGYSVGSWLHVDESGDTTARFNADDAYPLTAVAGYTDTKLVVASPAVPDGGRLELFDSKTGNMTPILTSPTPIKALAVAQGGAIYYLSAQPSGAAMSLNRIDDPADDLPDTVSHQIPGSTGTLAVNGRDTAVYVLTDAVEARVSDGTTTISWLPDAPNALALAVSDESIVLANASTKARHGRSVPLTVVGGSTSAQKILDRFLGCEKVGVTVDRESVTRALEGLCWIHSATAVGDRFVVSIGDGGGAVLAFLVPPDR